MSTPHRTIVVGYDGSDLGDLALAWAVDEAVGTGSDVQVLVATLPLAPGVWQVTDPHQRAVMQSVVARAEERAASLSPRGFAVELRQGDPASVLTDAGSHADMVVVGGRGHGRIEGMVLGAVSRHLAELAPCTVTVVRPSAGPAKGIVVGVEAGPGSGPALRYAMSRGQRSGEDVVAVHGWRPPRWLETDAPLSHIDTSSAQAQRLLAEVTAGLAEEFPDVRLTTTAVDAAPAEALCDVAVGASLVVVGAPHRSGLRRLHRGSVAGEVLQHAGCTVTVVR